MKTANQLKIQYIINSYTYMLFIKDQHKIQIQFWFRINPSSETALIKEVNYILVSSEYGLLSFLVVLELSAAFNTIKTILFDGLENTLGINGVKTNIHFGLYLFNLQVRF